MDVLAGLKGLEPAAQQRSAGVWADSDLHGAEIKPPVYVGRDVFISRGAKLGPGAVICAGSSVGAGAQVRQSVIDAAAVRDLSLIHI